MFLTANNATVNADKAIETVEQAAKKLPGFVQNLMDRAGYYALKIGFAIVIVFVLKKLIKLLIRFLDNAFRKGKMDESVRKFLLSLTKTLCYLGVVIILYNYLIGDKGTTVTAAITAIVGSAGLTLGLALQGSLQNFAGGVLILLLKPFKIGDYIIAEGYEGTVETIDIFYTKLLTIDNRMVVLPNGSLSNTSVTNVTGEEVRRLDLTVGIEYSEDISKVKTILSVIANSKEAVLKDREITIFVNDFEASSISMGIRVWCKTEDYWTLRWDMLENIKNSFDDNGIVIPFDQLDINLKNQ